MLARVNWRHAEGLMPLLRLQKKKEAAAKCLGSGGFWEGPPGWDLHNEELSPRMGHARAHGNRHD